MSVCTLRGWAVACWGKQMPMPCHPSMYVPVPGALINLSTLTWAPPTPLTPYLSPAASVLWVCLAQPCPLCLFTCLWGFLPSP